MLRETTVRVSNTHYIRGFFVAVRVSMNTKTVHVAVKLKIGMHVISLQTEADISAHLVLYINFNIGLSSSSVLRHIHV